MIAFASAEQKERKKEPKVNKCLAHDERFGIKSPQDAFAAPCGAACFGWSVVWGVKADVSAV
jgi:hypothetical protein